ncbi:MAG: hypothetical protein HY645_12655 [Acidobacteria bacterium]|nr:hypothetical protein [Acidobacteriota bacterium]
MLQKWTGPLLMWLFLLTTAIAAPIETFFPQDSGYRFVKTREIKGLGGTPSIAEVDAALLRDYTFIQYSRWEISSLRNPTNRTQLHAIEMMDPPGAFGIFSINKAGKPVNLPVENNWDGSQLSLWKGNFFLRLSGSDQEHLIALAQTLIQAIDQPNLKPVSVLHLPASHLNPDSTAFYLGENSLSTNAAFPRPLVQKLGFDKHIEIGFASYTDQRHPLFIVAYPTVKLAADYFFRMQQELQGYFSQQGIFMKRTGALIALFIGPEEHAQKILAEVKYSPTIKWVYKKTPDPPQEKVFTFLGLIKNAFLATGAFLLITFLGGLAAGVIRYQVLKRNPELGKRREMVRLNLSNH